MKRPLFVAELSINHLGMIGIARQMVVAAREAGADLVKLKHKNVERYYRDDGKKWRRFGFKDYRASLELSERDFQELDEFCREQGVGWFCTVHDLEGLEFMREFEVPYYKVASMDSRNLEFVDAVLGACREDGVELVVSIGGKNGGFTEELVQHIEESGVSAHVLHTVSIYPTPTGRSNVGYIRQLREKFESPRIRIGYSGHENGIAASLLAALHGCSLIERHFTLSRDLRIHHVEAALLPGEFRALTRLVEQLGGELRGGARDCDPEELRFLEDLEYD